MIKFFNYFFEGEEKKKMKLADNEMGLKRSKMKKLEAEMFVSAPLFDRSETVCITTKLFHFLSLLIWCYIPVRFFNLKISTL